MKSDIEQKWKFSLTKFLSQMRFRENDNAIHESWKDKKKETCLSNRLQHFLLTHDATRNAHPFRSSVELFSSRARAVRELKLLSIALTDRGILL